MGLANLALVWGAQAFGMAVMTPVMFVFLYDLLATTAELAVAKAELARWTGDAEEARRQLGVATTGEEFLDVLVEASRLGPIANLVVYGHAAPTALFCLPWPNERHESEDAALSPVVRSQDEDEVLHRDHQRERPEDEGQHAQDVLPRDGDAVRAVRRPWPFRWRSRSIEALARIRIAPRPVRYAAPMPDRPTM